MVSFEPRGVDTAMSQVVPSWTGQSAGVGREERRGGWSQECRVGGARSMGGARS